MPKNKPLPPESVAPPNLRTRTKLAMRSEVSDVAFRLFAQHGFDKTTVDQIAAEAGLSRTTFFRYFGGKEEIVLEKFGQFGYAVADALAARGAEESAWYALRRAFDVVVTSLTADESGSMVRLLSDACALMTRRWEKTEGWQATLVPLVSERLGRRAGSHGHLRANALVASAIACLDGATDAWRACDRSTSLAVLLDDAMGTVGDLRSSVE